MIPVLAKLDDQTQLGFEVERYRRRRQRKYIQNSTSDEFLNTVLKSELKVIITNYFLF